MGNTTIKPTRPVARLIRKRPTTIAAQVSITGRLFQTSAVLVPIAVRASTRSPSSIGIENALIAKEKAANNPPTAPPTSSMAHPVGVLNSMGTI